MNGAFTGNFATVSTENLTENNVVPSNVLTSQLAFKKWMILLEQTMVESKLSL